MAESPYITWYTSDFLNGIAGADMNAEQIGVYAVVLNLIADSGGPIEDDASWIGRRCNISTRRAGMILDQLAAMPNKIQRRKGLIGNPRMMREIGKRDGKSKTARAAANARWDRWRDEHKPQLPFDGETEKPTKKQRKAQKSAALTDANAQKGETAKNAELSPIYPGDNPEINPEISSHINSEKSQNTADPAMHSHPDSRAGVIPEPESIQTNNHKTHETYAAAQAAPGVDCLVGPDRDLMEWLQRCAAASGYQPISPGAIARAVDQMKDWRASGIDLTETIIPVIQAVTAKAHEPTNSFTRFDKPIRLQHAKLSGAKPGAKPRPPASPILVFEGEAELMQKVRADLLKRLGEARYCLYANHVRLDAVPTANGTSPLRVTPLPGHGFRYLLDEDRLPIVRAIARAHGFSDVWRG